MPFVPKAVLPGNRIAFTGPSGVQVNELESLKVGFERQREKDFVEILPADGNLDSGRFEHLLQVKKLEVTAQQH